MHPPRRNEFRMRRKSDAVTLSEQLFQQACDATGIRYRRLRVAKAAGYQRPDYKVNIPGCGAIVELKQIEPNAEDRRRIAEVAAGRTVVGSRSPGGRLRKAIQSGSAQLQRASLRGGRCDLRHYVFAVVHRPL